MYDDLVYAANNPVDLADLRHHTRRRVLNCLNAATDLVGGIIWSAVR